MRELLKKEEDFGIKKYSTYKIFGEKIYNIKKNVLSNIKKLKRENKKIVGYGAPAKATTALNFFGLSDEIEYIVEDNCLKHNKYIPGVKIQIRDKKNDTLKDKTVLVLAWNFFEEIKKNNLNLSSNFINIKTLENN